jgi:ankyrin repeat protein
MPICADYNNVNTYNQIAYGIYNDCIVDHEGKPLDFDKALLCASFGGHLHLVKLFIESASVDIINKCLCCAVCQFKYDVVSYLVQRCNDFHLVMETAVNKADINMVMYLIEKGVDDVNYALRCASILGKLDMVEYLILNGATNLNYALRCAASNNRVAVLNYLIEKGATDINSAMLDAVMQNNIPLAEDLIHRGAKNFELVLDFSISNKNFNMVKMFVEKYNVQITNFHINSAQEYDVNIYNYLNQ